MSLTGNEGRCSTGALVARAFAFAPLLHVGPGCPRPVAPWSGEPLRLCHPRDSSSEDATNATLRAVAGKTGILHYDADRYHLMAYAERLRYSLFGQPGHSRHWHDDDGGRGEAPAGRGRPPIPKACDVRL